MILITAAPVLLLSLWLSPHPTRAGSQSQAAGQTAYTGTEKQWVNSLISDCFGCNDSRICFCIILSDGNAKMKLCLSAKMAEGRETRPFARELLP